MDNKRIGTEYAGQWRRPEDAARENEEAERRAALGEHQSIGEHEGLAAFNEAWEQVTGELGATEVEAAPVDQAIMQVAAQSGQAVEQAKLSKDERRAKAFVDELERRGTVLGDTHFHSDDEPATPEETARLEAELELSGDDEEIGVDGAGNTIYKDSDTGEEYVLVDA